MGRAPKPCATVAAMSESLRHGFVLDRRWHWLRGEMERSKQPDLALLVEILDGRTVPYAIIGGVALQIHQREPRTTLDVDIAVMSRESLPRDLMLASGFVESGRHEHSDNWVAPGGTPIQITDDPALAEAVQRAAEVRVEALRLRVLAVEDLLHEKLRAARDRARWRSKRLQDLADAQSLLEQDPGLAGGLTPEERTQLDDLPR